MTDDDKPIEYEETTETSEDGTTRTTKIPKTSDREDSQDGETSKKSTKVFEASGKRHVVRAEFSAKRRVEANSHQDTSEDDSSDE